MSKLFEGVSEQKKAAKHRLDDAEALFRESRWRGSLYMAGYAIECLLKTKLMVKFGCRNLRDLEVELQVRGLLAPQATVFSHSLLNLLGSTGSLDRLRQNQPLWLNFALVNRWMPGWRYNPDLSKSDDARSFLDAVVEIARWIENNT
jgi:HEPN domain-containing protein